MKYILIVSFFLFPLSFVFAEDSSVTIPKTVEEIKQAVSEKKVKFKTEIEQKSLIIREDFLNNIDKKAEIQIFTQQKLAQNTSEVFEKFEAVLVKFQGISDRIDVRIQKLEEKGVNTTKQKELLLIAKQNIAQSFVLISAIRSEIEPNIVMTPISKEYIQKYIFDVKENLKNTQKSLVDVIVSLKVAGDISSESIIFE